MGKQTKFLPSFAKSPKDVSIPLLVLLRVTGSKYKTESFKSCVFGSNFLFHSITSSDTFPVKIKPNTMVRILLGFLSLARAAHECAEPTVISRLIPTDLSEAKTLSCMLGSDFTCKDLHLPTSFYRSEFSTVCSSPNSVGGLSTVSTFLHWVSKAKKYYLYLNQ